MYQRLTHDDTSKISGFTLISTGHSSIAHKFVDERIDNSRSDRFRELDQKKDKEGDFG